METFLKCLSANFGWSDYLPATQPHRNLMSSAVHAAYLIFSRAVLNLASSTDCVFCHMFFCKITTVVTWCQSALPIADCYPLSDIEASTDVPTFPL